ncbi:uncharacterized protein LOC131947844 isoform X2 [Physella acuta]|uniref:uncharacterized protein LOC131947844 isoform X2 n=1 Tax=Physella acuta TaxID=109671 RepID=UPI0027DBACFD|nr:uncharacterized protein LOC131947844 isoform X2 [Physella acuta]
MAVEKSSRIKKTFDVNSPVNKYEVLTLEKHTSGLNEEHIFLAFQALDELIPNLGVYSRIFQRLRQDLFEAVYSDELTGAVDKPDQFIQKLPYFTLVKQVYNQRHEQTDKLTEQVEILKKRLFDKHKQLEEVLQSLASKDEEINMLSASTKQLHLTIDTKEKETEELTNKLEEQLASAKMKEHQLECDIIDLKEALNDAKNQINFLSQFKNSYDNVYQAFMDKTVVAVNEKDSRKKKTSVIATKRATLLNSIHSAHKLEEQLLSVLNIAIEEYDKFIDVHKSNIWEKSVTEEMTETELDIQELEIADADQELEIIQSKFQNTANNLLTELGLLQQHTNMLQEQLQILEDSKPPPIKRKTGHTHENKGDSILSAGLEEGETSEPFADPFIPQERVFSKYAAMLYTSNNNGKTFEEFKDASFCASCGEKTIICPHKLSGPEKIFILPHNCSHVKMTRPKVRINKPASIEDPQSSAAVYPDLTSGKDLPSTPGTDFSRESSSLGTAEMYMERTKSVMEQFLGFLLWTDEYLTDQQASGSILDLLYGYMFERYTVEDAVYMAAHDFLSAVVQHGAEDKMLQLFSNVLIGNLDASCLRYVLLVCDFISAVEWREVEDFRTFASAIYPFLNEDDFESLQMSYTSYSENKISKGHVASFIIHIILKYREPRFHDLENKLVAYQVSENGQLNEAEFKEAVDNLMPLSNERLRQRLYLQAEKAVESDGIIKAVPIMKLAQISGYLALQQVTSVVKENVALKMGEARSATNNTARSEHSEMSTDQEKTETLLTMEFVKQMAFNINRQAKHRAERRGYSGNSNSEW